MSIPELRNTFECAHPVALVTGSGSRRVGRTIAMHLASLGCKVALHANTSNAELQNAANELRSSGSEALAILGDLRDEDVTAGMINQVVQAFGRIDILVNSAAIWSPTRLEDVTADELRNYFDVNAVGVFVAARAAGLQMVSQPSGGCIINLGDWATVRPYLDHAAYFPSKGAVETMTRSLAVELGSRNPRVRVNCIQPGPVLLASDVADDKRDKIAQSVLLKKVGTAQQIAHAVQFLCENDFVTGVTLPVDGGRSIFANDGMQTGLNTG